MLVLTFQFVSDAYASPLLKGLLTILTFNIQNVSGHLLLDAY